MNELSLQRGRGLKLGNFCEVLHPTLGQIEEQGYEKYMDYLFTIILGIKDIADVLWVEQKIWYEDIPSDWDFFLQRALAEATPIEIVSNLEDIQGEMSALKVEGKIKEALQYFLQLDGEFVFVSKSIEGTDKNQIILFNTQKLQDNTEQIKYFIDDKSFKFTEHFYDLTVKYLKQINWIAPDYEFTKGGTKFAKKYILEKLYKKRNRNHSQNITIASINSSIMGKGIQNTWDLPIYLFYESYYRLTKIDEYQNTMSALYSGNIDTQKHPIEWEKINWSSVIKI